MARRIRAITPRRAVLCCLLAWSVAVVIGDESVPSPVTTWGLEDQTAAVGRLFELRLPSVENTTTTLTVRYADMGSSKEAGGAELSMG